MTILGRQKKKGEGSTGENLQSPPQKGDVLPKKRSKNQHFCCFLQCLSLSLLLVSPDIAMIYNEGSNSSNYLLQQEQQAPSAGLYSLMSVTTMWRAPTWRHMAAAITPPAQGCGKRERARCKHLLPHSHSSS